MHTKTGREPTFEEMLLEYDMQNAGSAPQTVRWNEKEMNECAKLYGFYLQIHGNTAYVSTDVAFWYYVNAGDSIDLYHQNVTCSDKRHSDAYHKQDISYFTNPAEVLQYIYNHDIAHIRRYSEIFS